MDFSKRIKKRKLMEKNEGSGDETSNDTEIYINNNHIYFSGDITSKSSFLLCKNIRMLESELMIEEVEKNIKNEMFLHITTDGGCSGCWGKLAYIDDTYKNCIKIQEHINNFYLTKTKINKKMLKDLLVKDLQFNADECINMGVADSIYVR